MMVEQRGSQQLDFMCPKCSRNLIASAHDGHLFCPDCGHQSPKPLTEEQTETESFENGT